MDCRGLRGRAYRFSAGCESAQQTQRALRHGGRPVDSKTSLHFLVLGSLVSGVTLSSLLQDALDLPAKGPVGARSRYF